METEGAMSARKRRLSEEPGEKEREIIVKKQSLGRKEEKEEGEELQVDDVSEGESQEVREEKREEGRREGRKGEEEEEEEEEEEGEEGKGKKKKKTALISWDDLDFSTLPPLGSNDSDPKLLKVQNAALGRQIRVYKSEADSLRKHVDASQKSLDSSSKQLSVISHHWAQLELDLEALATKLHLPGGLQLPNALESSFLKNSSVDSQEVQARSERVTTAVNKLTAYVDHVLNARLSGLQNGETDSLGSQFSTFQETLDKLQAEKRSVESKFLAEENEKLRLLSALQSVQERCDDTEFELSNIRVSLERYKSLAVHPAHQAVNTQTASATPDLQVAAVKSEPEGEVSSIMQELEELTRINKERLNEIKGLEAKILEQSALLHSAKMASSGLSSEQVKSSDVYRILSNQHDATLYERDEWRQFAEKKEKEYNDLKEENRRTTESFRLKENDLVMRHKREVDDLRKEIGQCQVSSESEKQTLMKTIQKYNDLKSTYENMRQDFEVTKRDKKTWRQEWERLQQRFGDASFQQQQLDCSTKIRELRMKEEETKAMLEIVTQAKHPNPDFNIIREKIFRLEARLGDANNKKMAEYEARIQELQFKLTQSLGGEKAMCNEMNDMGRALEETQNKFSQLMQQIAAKDAMAAQTMTENIQAKHRESLYEKEKEALNSKVDAFEKICRKLADEKKVMELYTKTLTQESKNFQSEASLQASMVEKSQQVAVAKSQECETLKLRLESCQATITQFQKDNADNLKATFEAKRLQEELSSLKKRNTVLERNASKGPKNLVEEVEAYKKLLKCTVCQLNTKDTVLLKCCHVFCRQCITVRYDTRQRKCPVCAEPFAQTEIKAIYL